MICRWHILVVDIRHVVSFSSWEIVRVGKGTVLEVDRQSQAVPGHLIVSFVLSSSIKLHL